MGRKSEQLNELQNDLKASAEDLTADAERVQAIEAEKVELPPGHPRAVELAAEAEDLTQAMVDKARAQSALIGEAAAEI